MWKSEITKQKYFLEIISSYDIAMITSIKWAMGSLKVKYPGSFQVDTQCLSIVLMFARI